MDNETRLRKAQSILNDELFNEAFDTLRHELMERWKNSSTHEVDAREQIWLGLQLLQQVRRHFESILETAEMSKHKDKNSFI